MLADIRGLRLGKRRVVIVPDADYASNPAVFDGLRDLVGTFDPLTGGKVTVAKLSALGGKTGLDDYLAGLGEDQRAEVIGNLIETSGRQFGKRPRESKVFEIADKVSFFTAGFARSLVETFAGELAVDELDEQLLVRHAGVWTPALEVPAVRAFLLDGSGESYSERRIATVVELAASRLQLAGETVPERPTEPIVAFRNGIVRLDERAATPTVRRAAGDPDPLSDRVGRRVALPGLRRVDRRADSRRGRPAARRSGARAGLRHLPVAGAARAALRAVQVREVAR